MPARPTPWNYGTGTDSGIPDEMIEQNREKVKVTPGTPLIDEAGKGKMRKAAGQKASRLPQP